MPACARVPPQNVARRRQLLEIWIRPVPNETGQFALRAALREFQKFVDNGMTQERVRAHAELPVEVRAPVRA